MRHFRLILITRVVNEGSPRSDLGGMVLASLSCEIDGIRRATKEDSWGRCF